MIALVINNWNEDRKEKKYLNQIYASIEKEFKENKLDIEENLPKQQVLTDSLGRYMNDESVTIFEIITKAKGIYGPTIKNNSWKAIANTKIELVEFETLSLLTEIEESKEDLKLKREKVLEFMIENLKNTSTEKKEIFMLLNQELVSTEKQILLEMNDYLDK